MATVTIQQVSTETVKEAIITLIQENNRNLNYPFPPAIWAKMTFGLLQQRRFVMPH